MEAGLMVIHLFREAVAGKSRSDVSAEPEQSTERYFDLNITSRPGGGHRRHASFEMQPKRRREGDRPTQNSQKERHLLLAAGADAQPGRLGNLIGFIGSRPASRCHETISCSAQVPDAFVSAKKRSITAGTPPPAPGCDGLRKSPIA